MIDFSLTDEQEAVAAMVKDFAEREVYPDPEDGDTGTPLAQALYAVPGLFSLTIEGKDLIIGRDPGVEWHDLVEDISDVLRDFFL